VSEPFQQNLAKSSEQTESSEQTGHPELPKYSEKLPEPVKNLPFRLATTSFIYRDRIVPNVQKLGALFDEIELLIFESRPFIPEGRSMMWQGKRGVPVEVLPTPQEICQLAELSKSLGVTYNIHLPVDVSLTDRSRSERLKAVDVVRRVVELCAPLNPTTYTLHIEYDIDCYDLPSPPLHSRPSHPHKGEKDQGKLHQDQFKQWQERACNSLEKLSSSISDPSLISIETLHYPFEYIGDIVDQFGMSVSIDAGHLILHGYSIDDLFEKYGERVPLIHLHGVDFSSEIPKDHKSLDLTPPDLMVSTLNVMRHFTGVVSLEVFSYEDLSSSLTFLNNVFMKKPQTRALCR